MKRLVAIVLVGALSTPGCALPLTTHGPRMVHGASMWGNVVSLPPNTVVRVFTRVTWLEGALIAADDVDLRTAHETRGRRAPSRSRAARRSIAASEPRPRPESSSRRCRRRRDVGRNERVDNGVLVHSSGRAPLLGAAFASGGCHNRGNLRRRRRHFRRLTTPDDLPASVVAAVM